MKTSSLLKVLAAGLLLSSAAHLGAADTTPLRLVVIDYTRLTAGFTQMVDFGKHIDGEVQKVRDAVSIKGVTREALVKQANDIIASKTKDMTDEEVRKKIQPMVTAIEATDKEIKDLQTAPEINKEVTETTATLRAKIRTAVEAEVAQRGVDLVLDVASVNGAGLAIAIPAKGGRLPDITDAVLTRLNAATPAAPAK